MKAIITAIVEGVMFIVGACLVACGITIDILVEVGAEMADLLRKGGMWLAGYEYRGRREGWVKRVKTR